VIDIEQGDFSHFLSTLFCEGSKLFPSLPADASIPYKFVSMIFQCTGGGIIVPILINSIPVSLGVDAYPIAILVSFLIHEYFPIMREVLNLSKVFKVCSRDDFLYIAMYEI
jgi:hypothetical protein